MSYCVKEGCSRNNCIADLGFSELYVCTLSMIPKWSICYINDATCEFSRNNTCSFNFNENFNECMKENQGNAQNITNT